MALNLKSNKESKNMVTKKDDVFSDAIAEGKKESIRNLAATRMQELAKELGIDMGDLGAIGVETMNPAELAKTAKSTDRRLEDFMAEVDSKRIAILDGMKKTVHAVVSNAEEAKTLYNLINPTGKSTKSLGLEKKNESNFNWVIGRNKANGKEIHLAIKTSLNFRTYEESPSKK